MQASLDSEQMDLYANTMDIVEHPSAIGRPNIATHNFSNFERLIFAITDDDVATFDRLGMQIEDVANLEFDAGACVLNFAIE